MNGMRVAPPFIPKIFYPSIHQSHNRINLLMARRPTQLLGEIRESFVMALNR